MNVARHAALGAVVAVLPDAALALFGWRKTWLMERHPLVRMHRWLHSPEGMGLVLIACWYSHLIADRFSRHRQKPF